MSNLKKVLFMLGFMTISLCQAQIIKTPEVFSFEQEVFRPVSYYTGQVNISIPLTKIQTNEITIPITLNYVGGAGLRAINPYSNVGMGWRITAGGVISRTKNEVCDESTVNTNGALKGFFSLIADVPNTVTNSYVRNNVNSYVATDPQGHHYFNSDYEYSPDVFSFNFLGYTGFFVMGYDGQFKINSKDIVSVEKSYNNTYPDLSNCMEFKLTANDGTKFLFGSKNGSVELSGGNGGIPFQCNAWYITSIEFTNGRIINFNYQPNNSPTIPIVYYTASIESTSNSAVSPVILDNITFNGGKVVFSSSQVNQYITGQVSFPRMINRIELQDNNSRIMDSVRLSYSPENLQRYYFLDSVRIGDKKYSFEYYNRAQLPDIDHSLGSDYWGFYNGETEVTSMGLGDVSSYWDWLLNPTVTYPVRMPYLDFAKRGILTSITYPTGGVESYEYEANTYSDIGVYSIYGNTYNSFIEPKIAGGLRIAKITLGDMVRKYKYVQTFDAKKPDYDPQTMSPIGYTSSGILYRLPGVPYFGRSAVNAITIDGEPTIVYSKVIEFLPDSSYTEYTMRSPLEIPDRDNSLNPNYFSVWSSDARIFDSYLERAFIGSLGKNSSCSIERGKVSAIKVYDKLNTLKKSTKYTYSADSNRYNEFVAALSIKGVDQELLKFGAEIGLLHLGKSIYLSIINSYEIYTFPVYLEQVNETTYDDIDSIRKITRYKYNSQGLRSSVTTYDSKGDSLKLNIRYPADINSGSYASMASKKMLNIPIEQIQIKNTSIVRSSLTTYKPSGNSFVADKKYALSILSPLPASAFSYFNGYSKDSRYESAPEAAYDKYDDFGNLISARGRDGIPVSYQWGYDNRYLVAEVRNAENSLVTTTTTSTAYGSLYMPSYSASTSFTTTVPGTIAISIMGDPGYTYAVSYSFTGANNGVLCASRSSVPCTYPGSVTLTNRPAGTYHLSLSLYSGDAGLKGVTYSYPVLQTVTTGALEYFYQGFEEESGATTGGAFAGRKYRSGDYTVPFTLSNSRNYVVNYRYLEGGVWKNMTKPFASNMTLMEGTAIDEVRVYPADAQMTTYTYEPLIGMTSMTDENNRTTFYEYDDFGRLHLVRDNDGNIVKKICYNYAGQPEDCND